MSSGVNELSTNTITVRPFDETGAPVTPSSARYRLDDKASLAAIIAWTTIATLSTSMDIVIPATDNAILNTNLPTETKVLTVETDFSTSAAHVEEFEYVVTNLQFVS